MEVSDAVKQGISKLEGATQKSEFWGQIWGQNTLWGQFGGIKKSLYVRLCLLCIPHKCLINIQNLMFT